MNINKLYVLPLFVASAVFLGGCGKSKDCCLAKKHIKKKAFFMTTLHKNLEAIKKKGFLDKKQAEVLFELKDAVRSYCENAKRTKSLWVMKAAAAYQDNGSFEDIELETDAMFREQKAELATLLHKFELFNYILKKTQRKKVSSDMVSLLKSILYISVDSYPKMRPIGINVGNYGKVKQVFRGTPAEDALVMRGDIVMSINGIPLRNRGADISRIADIAGRDVDLLVNRGGENKKIELSRKFMGDVK